jgi:hypothetical protein
VAEVRRKFWNPEEGEYPPLEAAIRVLVKLTEKTLVRVIVNCSLCSSVNCYR